VEEQGGREIDRHIQGGIVEFGKILGGKVCRAEMWSKYAERFEKEGPVYRTLGSWKREMSCTPRTAEEIDD